MGDWQRLGERVRARRERLGLTPAEVQARGGPSVATVGKIERAEQDSYKPRSLRRLEDALGWERDSVRAVLQGQEPRVAEDEAIADARRRAAERAEPPSAALARKRLNAARVAIDEAMAVLDQMEGK